MTIVTIFCGDLNGVFSFAFLHLHFTPRHLRTLQPGEMRQFRDARTYAFWEPTQTALPARLLHHLADPTVVNLLPLLAVNRHFRQLAMKEMTAVFSKETMASKGRPAEFVRVSEPAPSRFRGC